MAPTAEAVADQLREHRSACLIVHEYGHLLGMAAAAQLTGVGDAPRSYSIFIADDDNMFTASCSDYAYLIKDPSARWLMTMAGVVAGAAFASAHLEGKQTKRAGYELLAECICDGSVSLSDRTVLLEHRPNNPEWLPLVRAFYESGRRFYQGDLISEFAAMRARLDGGERITFASTEDLHRLKFTATPMKEKAAA